MAAELPIAFFTFSALCRLLGRCSALCPLLLGRCSSLRRLLGRCSILCRLLGRRFRAGQIGRAHV